MVAFIGFYGAKEHRKTIKIKVSMVTTINAVLSIIGLYGGQRHHKILKITLFMVMVVKDIKKHYKKHLYMVA